MDDRRWEQYGAATGMGAVILWAVAAFLPGQAPKPGAEIGEIQAFITGSRGELMAQSFMFGVGSIFLLWFAGSLRAYLGRLEGTGTRLSLVSFGGAVALVSIGAASSILPVTLVWRNPQGVDPAVFRLLWESQFVGFTMTGIALAIFAGAASLAILRTEGLPTWIAWMGAIAAGVGVAMAATIFAEIGDAAPGGNFTYFAFMFALAWILVTSVALVGKVGPQPAEAAAAG